MKKLVLMMALGMLVAGGAYAQEMTQKEKKQRTEHRAKKGAKMQKMDPEERAKKQTEMMGQKLGLSAAQKSELQALNLRRTQEMKALKTKYGKTDARNEAQRAERKAIQDKWHADLKNVLNEKQYAQFETERQERRERIIKAGKTKGQRFDKEKTQKQNG